MRLNGGLWEVVEDCTGGESGIRTRDTLTDIPVFETGAFNHSATSPRGQLQIITLSVDIGNLNPQPLRPEMPARATTSPA